MTESEPDEVQRRSRGPLLMAIGLVFALQIVLLVFLSDRAPAAPPRAVAKPVFPMRQLTPDQLFALRDPTLFAVPHPGQLYDAAQPAMSVRGFHVTNWSEPARALAPIEQTLGADFARFGLTNTPPAATTVAMAEPALTPPPLAPLIPISVVSTLRFEGRLSQRRLITPVDLPGWPGADLLTNTVVQLLVDGQGNVAFAALSPRRSGSEKADQDALQRARALRFEPVATVGPDRPRGFKPEMTAGTAVFEWQTLPVTNGLSAAPAP